MIYFDNAATTLKKPPQVIEAVTQSFSAIGNSGRGGHGAALSAARMIYDTRVLMAELIHAEEPECIAFTGNATESLNIAINGLIAPGDHVVITVCEHNSVLRPLYRKMEQGAEVTIVPADPESGDLNYQYMEGCCRENTKAIVVTHASNLTGNLTDLQKVSEIAKAHHALLIVDAAQTAGTVPIDVRAMGIDVLCFTGHKGLLGPQGTGGIYVRKGLSVIPFKVGGSGVHSYDHAHPAQMPAALEAGTLNGHGLAGLHAALEYIHAAGVDKIRDREMALCCRFMEGVSRVPGVVVYGQKDFRKKTAIVTINIGDTDAAIVADWLWENYEIAVRAGAHCAPLMHETFGTKNQGAVRFSFSYENTEEEIDTAIQAISEFASLL